MANQNRHRAPSKLGRWLPIAGIVAAFAAGILAGNILLGGDQETAPGPAPTVTVTAQPATAEPTTAAPEPTAAVDPYEHYLDIAPPDAVELGREDAQTRALLGCGLSFAPGTQDAALAEAYGGLCP